MRAEAIARALFLKYGRLRPILRMMLFAPAAVIASGLLFYAIEPFLGGAPAPDFSKAQLGYQFMAAFEAASCAAIVGVSVLFRRYVDRRSVASLGFAFRAGWLRLFSLGILFGAAMQLVVFAIEAAPGYVRIGGIASARSDGLEIATYAPLFIVAALSEEMLLRGYVFQNLWEEWGAPAGLILSSALFAVLHLRNPNSHANIWLTFAGLAAFGMWACLSYMWTKSLWLALGAHFAWNLFEGPVLGFPVSGLSTGTSAIAQSVSGPVWVTGGPFGPESGASSLIALAAGLAALYWLRRSGAFDAAFDARETYARTKTKAGL